MVEVIDIVDDKVVDCVVCTLVNCVAVCVTISIELVDDVKSVVDACVYEVVVLHPSNPHMEANNTKSQMLLLIIVPL